MLIRDRSTGQIFFESEWRLWILSNGGPNFTDLTNEILELLNADIVYERDKPIATRYQHIVQQGVVQDDNKWYVNWVAVDMNQDERSLIDLQKSLTVRTDRDHKLQNTDWVVIKTYETSSQVPVEWSRYRQALRDIPQQAGFPWEVEWPEKPE